MCNHCERDLCKLSRNSHELSNPCSFSLLFNYFSTFSFLLYLQSVVSSFLFIFYLLIFPLFCFITFLVCCFFFFVLFYFQCLLLFRYYSFFLLFFVLLHFQSVVSSFSFYSIFSLSSTLSLLFYFQSVFSLVLFPVDSLCSLLSCSIFAAYPVPMDSSLSPFLCHQKVFNLWRTNDRSGVRALYG